MLSFSSWNVARNKPFFAGSIYFSCAGSKIFAKKMEMCGFISESACIVLNELSFILIR